MNMRDYGVFGCSLYSMPSGRNVFGFWLEDKNTGNSELLFVTKERFFRETGIEVDVYKNFILNCKKCVNTSCHYNPRRDKNDPDVRFIPYLGEQSFLDKRAEVRINISLNVRILILSNLDIGDELDCRKFDNYFPVKMLNISSNGCMLSYSDEYEERVPDVGDNLEIKFVNDVYINQNNEAQDIFVYKFSGMSPIICEVMWKVSGSMGVQFVISRKKDISMVRSFLGEIKSTPFGA